MSTQAHTVALAGSLDMTAAAPLARDILAGRGQPLVLDASGVRRLGGQCLQVLIAAQAAWAEDGVSFEIAQPSAEFQESLALLGWSSPALAASEPCAPEQD
jgi:anti-anti-sigma regulatory factor